MTALGSWIDRVIALWSRMDHVIALRQISVTALFYLEDSRKIHLRGVRARRSKDTKSAPARAGERERERETTHAHCRWWVEKKSAHMRGREKERALWLLLCFFLPLGLPYANWASQECCLFYLKSSLWSSDLSLTFVCSIFVGFSLPCLLASTILDSCFLF